MLYYMCTIELQSLCLRIHVCVLSNAVFQNWWLEMDVACCPTWYIKLAFTWSTSIWAHWPLTAYILRKAYGCVTVNFQRSNMWHVQRHHGSVTVNFEKVKHVTCTTPSWLCQCDITKVKYVTCTTLSWQCHCELSKVKYLTCTALSWIMHCDITKVKHLICTKSTVYNSS